MESRDDALIERLGNLFLEHPAWVEAARQLDPRATSSVWFRHRPGEPFRLEQREGRSELLPGRATDPDLVFCFSAHAIERLEGVRGGIGDFAVELFASILEEDPDEGVGFRIAASFVRLVRRGYVRLLLVAGPKVAAFGATHGIRSLRGLHRFVSDLRRQGPAAWETDESR